MSSSYISFLGTSATSLSINDILNAPRSVYTAQCAVYNVKPNAAVLALLGGVDESDQTTISTSTDKGDAIVAVAASPSVPPYSITTLDMRCTFLGAQGCKALLGFVRKHASIQTLNLTKSGMDSEAIAILCATITSHPSLRTVVLDHNKLSVPSARSLWDTIRGCRLGSAIESISLRGCGLQEEWESRINRSLEVHRTFSREGFFGHGHLRPVHEWRSIPIGVLSDSVDRCRTTCDVVIPFIQTLLNPLKIRVAPVVIAVDSEEDGVMPLISRRNYSSSNNDGDEPFTLPESILTKLQMCRDNVNDGLPWLIVALDGGDNAPLGPIVTTLLPAILSWFEHAQPPPLKDRLGRTRAKVYRTPPPAAVFVINTTPQNRRVAEQLLSEGTIRALNHKDDLFGALSHTGILHPCGNNADFVVSCVTWLLGSLSTVYDAPPLLALEVTRRYLELGGAGHVSPSGPDGTLSAFDDHLDQMVVTGVDATTGVLLSTDSNAVVAMQKEIMESEASQNTNRSNNDTTVSLLARHGLVKGQSSITAPSRPATALNPTPPATIASATYKTSNRRFSAGTPPQFDGSSPATTALATMTTTTGTTAGVVDVSETNFHRLFLASQKLSSTPLAGTRPYQLLEERMSDVVADWCDLGRDQHPSDVQDVAAYCLREASSCSFPFVLYGGSGCGKKYVLCGAAAAVVEHNQVLLQHSVLCCECKDFERGNYNNRMGRIGRKGISSGSGSSPSPDGTSNSSPPPPQPAKVPIPYLVGIAPASIAFMVDYLLFALESIRSATVNPSDLKNLASKRPVPTDESFSSVQLLMAKLADELANYPASAPPIVIFISNIQDLQVPCGRASWGSQSGSPTAPVANTLLTSATPEECLRWLPAVLPAHVRVVVTVDTASALLPRLRGRVPQPYERLTSNASQLVTATSLGNALRRKGLQVPGLASASSSTTADGEPPQTAPAREEGYGNGTSSNNNDYGGGGDWVTCEEEQDDVFGDDDEVDYTTDGRHIPRPPPRGGGASSGSRPPTVPAASSSTKFTTYHGPGSISAPVLPDPYISTDTVSAAHALVTKEEAHCYPYPTLAVSFLEMMGATSNTAAGSTYFQEGGSDLPSSMSQASDSVGMGVASPLIPAHNNNTSINANTNNGKGLQWDTPESLRLLIRDQMPNTVAALTEQLMALLEGVIAPSRHPPRPTTTTTTSNTASTTPQWSMATISKAVAPDLPRAGAPRRRASSVVGLGALSPKSNGGPNRRTYNNNRMDDDDDELFQPYFKNRNQSVVIAPLNGSNAADDDDMDDSLNDMTMNETEVAAYRTAETLRDVALCLVVCPLSASDLIAVVEDAMGNPKDSTMGILQWMVNLGLITLNYDARYQTNGSQVREGIIGFYGATCGLGDGVPQERHQCSIAAYLHSVVVAGGLSMVDVLPNLLSLWLSVGEYTRAADLLTTPEILEEMFHRDAPAARSAIIQGYLQLIALLENLEESGSTLERRVAVECGAEACFMELQRSAQSLSSEPQCGLHTTRMSRVMRRILRDFTSLSSTSLLQMCLMLPEDSVLYRRAHRSPSLPHSLAVPVAGKQTESSSAHTVILSNHQPIRHTSSDPLTKDLVCVTTARSLTVLNSSDGSEVAHLDAWSERLNMPVDKTIHSAALAHHDVEFISAFFVPFHLVTAAGRTHLDRTVVVVCADRILLWSIAFSNVAPYTTLAPTTPNNGGSVGTILGVATNYTASGSKRIVNDEGTLLVMYHVQDGHIALLDIHSRKVLSSFLPAYPTPTSNSNNNLDSTTTNSSTRGGSRIFSPTRGSTMQGSFQGIEEQQFHEARPADVREAVFAGNNVVIVSGYDCFVYSATRIQSIPVGSNQQSIDVTQYGGNSSYLAGSAASTNILAPPPVTLSRVVKGGVAPQVLIHPGAISAMCVSADGRFLASAVGACAFIWDISSGAQLHVCEDTERSVSIRNRTVPEIADNTIRCVSFHPTGATLIVGITDGSVIVYSTVTGCVATKFHVTTGLPPHLLEEASTLHRLSRLGCTGCAYSDDAQRIVCRFGPILRLFDGITFDDRGVVVAHGGTDITTICAVPQGPVVTTNGTGEVKFFAPTRQLPTLLMALTEVTHSEGVSSGGRLIPYAPTLGDLTSTRPCGILQSELGTKDGTFINEPDTILVVLSSRNDGTTELGAYLWDDPTSTALNNNHSQSSTTAAATVAGRRKSSNGAHQKQAAAGGEVPVSSAAGVVLVAQDVMVAMDDYTLVEYILQHGLPAVKRIPQRRLRVLIRSSAVDAVLSGHDTDGVDPPLADNNKYNPQRAADDSVVIREAIYDHCLAFSRMATVTTSTSSSTSSASSKRRKVKKSFDAANGLIDDDYGQIPLPLCADDEASIARFKRQIKLRRLLDEVERGGSGGGGIAAGDVLANDDGSTSGSRCRLLTHHEKLAHKIWACDSAVSSFALVPCIGDLTSVIFTIANHCLVAISGTNGATVLTHPLPRGIDSESKWTISYDEAVERIVIVGTPRLSKSTRILVYTVTAVTSSPGIAEVGGGAAVVVASPSPILLVLVGHFQGHKGVCYATVMPPRYKGDVLVSVGSDRTVRLWTTTGHAERSSYTHDCLITSAVVTGPNTISMFDERMKATIVSIGARAQSLQVGTSTHIDIPFPRCVQTYMPALPVRSMRSTAVSPNEALSQIMAAAAVPDSDGLIVLATALSQILLYDSKTDKVISQLSVDGRWPVSTPLLSMGSLVQAVNCQVFPGVCSSPTYVVTASTRGGEVLVFRLLV